MLYNLSLDAILILILLHIKRDNRQLFLLRDRYFQLNIKYYSMSVQFIIVDIATCCSDNDCLKYCLLRILLLHLQWSKMMTIKCDHSKNQSTQILVIRYKNCCEFSLTLKHSANKHLSIRVEKMWVVLSFWQKKLNSLWFDL